MRHRLEEGGDLGRVAVRLAEEPLGGEAVEAVGMLEGLHEAGGLGQHFRLLVLEPPDAAMLVVAVGPDRGVVRIVLGPARVVVDGRLVVEVGDVERAVGADLGVDGPEPEAGAGDELLGADFCGGEGDAVGTEAVLVDEIDRALGDKVDGAVLVGPCAAVVEGTAGGGGEAAHVVDLEVRVDGGLEGRAGVAVVGDVLPALFDRGGVAAGEGLVGHDDVAEVGAVGHGEEDLAVPAEVHAPGVRVVGRDDLDLGAVGAEAEEAVADLPHRLAVFARDVRAAARVALGGVDPAVEPPAEVARDRVGVAEAEAAEEDLALVGCAVAVGVAEEEDLGRLHDDEAVLVEDEAGDEVELVVEDGAAALVEEDDAVARPGLPELGLVDLR